MVENTIDILRSETSFFLRRNGQNLQTPKGRPLAVPTHALAEALAIEWSAQGKKINPATLPLTQLAATALDLVADDRHGMTTRLVAMTETELLCHRAPYPSTLAARQAAAWDPVLDWSAQHLGIPFHPSADLIAQKQTPQNMTLLHKRLAHYDDFTFTGLRHTAEVCGSLLLGLALTEGHIQAEHVLALSEIESDFQMENWGHDEATLKRRASIANDLNVCATWFEKLKDTP